MPDPSITDRSNRPPFIQPYLEALDRLKARNVVLEAGVVRGRAVEMLGDDDATVGFAYAPTGILGEHTHYFDGFALLMPLPMGVAVACRPSEDGGVHIVFDGDEATWSIAHGKAVDETWPGWVRLVYEIFRSLAPEGGFRIAVVSTVFAECFDAYVSALTVACARSALSLAEDAPVERSTVRELRSVVETTVGIPFSPAYIIGAFYGRPAQILLVDAATFEYLPVPTPEDEELAWCVVQAGRGPVADAEFYRGQKLAAERAVEELQAGAFPELTTFRELEHRHLERALSEVSAPRRAIVRHLVTENRRVQKAVVALRKGDWQFVGALLLMSHGSLANDWRSTSPDIDRVVELVEAMSIEGMHGACMSSRGGCAIVCGRRFIMSKFLDRLATDFRREFGYEPAAIVL